jgi:hypothetical protein
MNAKYRALHEASVRINKSLDARGIVNSPYKDADADNIYQMMVDLVPVGTAVRATYISNPAKPNKMVTREGTVTGHIQISFDEPDFHIYFAGTNTTSHFPGSVLEEI